MSEAGAPPGARSVNELRVSGHLMTLDAGLFCVVQNGTGGEDATGLPGVRVSLPPGPVGRPDAVTISTFRDDGWLSGRADAALIRVAEGPAQILVTIYQAPGAQREPPRLQLVRLGDAAQHAQGPGAGSGAGPGAPAAAQAAAQPAAQAAPEGTEPPVPAHDLVAAHVQQRGDVTVPLGEWIGERGSKRWIEGFGIAPPEGCAAEDLEYQAVLGRGWLSPWAHGGQYCGSRGMALPLLGLRVRLRGAAAETHDCELTRELRGRHRDRAGRGRRPLRDRGARAARGVPGGVPAEIGGRGGGARRGRRRKRRGGAGQRRNRPPRCRQAGARAQEEIITTRQGGTASQRERPCPPQAAGPA